MTPLRLLAAAIALLPATPAAADCAASARYAFSYANQAAATLAYGATYTLTAATSGGATRAFSATITQNGLSSTQINGAPIALTADQAIGTGAAGNNADTGTVSASFAQPVTSISVRYGNAPLTGGESATGQQGIGIAGISFCPMPEISVAKSSAPVGSGAFSVPGADVAYTLTVANTGASPVDAGTIVLTDLLPPGIRFRNTPLDAGTGLPVSLAAGASGVTLSPASLAFTSNAGASWSYVPEAGYDDAVNGVRVTAGGTMAAGSSFSVSFIGQVR